jgi:enoyl-CoA hydratase
MSDEVELRIAENVAEVTINRPPVNALARSTMRRIMAVFSGLADQSEARVVILTGHGSRAFCGGRDIKDLRAERNEPPSRHVGDPYWLTRETFLAVRHCPVPVIAAVNGPAVGAGLALVAVSDMAIAASTATFALPEIDVGVLGASSFAQWMVGPFKSRRMFFTGTRVPAAEMHRLGVLETVVPPEELMREARSLAQEIASKNPVAIRLAKASVLRVDTLPLEQAYRTEQDYTRILSAYPDSMAAIEAFGSKGDS